MKIVLSEMTVKAIKYRAQKMKKQNAKLHTGMGNFSYDYSADVRKEYRIMKQMCKHCHYPLSTIGNRRKYYSKCFICGESYTAKAEVINLCCAKCAKKYNVCVICGAEMD